jgi:hypothetical protein
MVIEVSGARVIVESVVIVGDVVVLVSEGGGGGGVSPGMGPLGSGQGPKSVGAIRLGSTSTVGRKRKETRRLRIAAHPFEKEKGWHLHRVMKLAGARRVAAGRAG